MEPLHGRAKARRPARTYIQQLSEDTGYISEDLPEVMNDKEEWRARVRDIRTGGTTRWWWYVFLFFRKELKLLWFVRQTDAGRQDRLLYWPITFQDHSMLCYLQEPLSISSPSRSGLFNRRPSVGPRPQRAHSQWLQTSFDLGLYSFQLSQLEAAQLAAAALSRSVSLTANWLPLWPSLSPTLSTTMGICIYYFITTTSSD